MSAIAAAAAMSSFSDSARILQHETDYSSKHEVGSKRQTTERQFVELLRPNRIFNVTASFEISRRLTKGLIVVFTLFARTSIALLVIVVRQRQADWGKLQQTRSETGWEEKRKDR